MKKKTNKWILNKRHLWNNTNLEGVYTLADSMKPLTDREKSIFIKLFFMFGGKIDEN